jgi:ubiquinone/menaquinone biosynthesis C-methylase UbiE
LPLKRDLWYSVIRAIEKSIPEYDFVNDKVSFGLAQKARNFAVQQLQLQNGMRILDAGIGPGTMSEAILRDKSRVTIVGFDASIVLLLAARKHLRSYAEDRLHLVRGAFEALPFTSLTFPRIVSAYAFRDARDRDTAIHEFCRAGSENGIFTIVDLGKPENIFKRSLISIHIRYLVPLISRLFMSRAVEGNPWRMIFPTYQALAKNGELLGHLRESFSNVRIHEFAWGGMIVIIARKSQA